MPHKLSKRRRAYVELALFSSGETVDDYYLQSSTIDTDVWWDDLYSYLIMKVGSNKESEGKVLYYPDVFAHPDYYVHVDCIQILLEQGVEIRPYLTHYYKRVAPGMY